MTKWQYTGISWIVYSNFLFFILFGLTKEESDNLLYKSRVYQLIQDIDTGLYEEDHYFIYETMLQDEMKYGSIIQREF